MFLILVSNTGWSQLELELGLKPLSFLWELIWMLSPLILHIWRRDVKPFYRSTLRDTTSLLSLPSQQKMALILVRSFLDYIISVLIPFY